MKKFLLICVIAMFVIISNTFSQTGWKYFKYKDLPVPSISFCIQSDYNGGIFLGGSGGLMKYNSIEWIKIYYNELDPMAQDNKFNIRRVICSGGEVWAGTNEGLIKFNGYDRKHYNLTNNPSMFDDKTRGITRDKYGNIWFVNHAMGIFKLDKTSDTVVRYSIPQTTPLPFSEDIPMFCDGYDNIWYSCAGKFVKFSDSKIKIIDSTEISELKKDTVSSIQIMSDNSIIVLMKHSIGQYKYYNGTISYNKLDVPANLLETNEIFTRLKVDLDGNIWVLSNLTDGMGIASKHFYKHSKNKEWTKYEFPKFDFVQDNLSFTDFTIDEKGKVWFTDPYNGVFVFDSKVTSVEDRIEKGLIQISPNPTTDYFTINTNQEIGKIEIFSALGIKVFETEWQEKIDVSEFMPGVYFVRVGDKVSKFIKI